MSESVHSGSHDFGALRRQNRLIAAALALSIAVHTAAMTEALQKLYGAEKIAQELLTGAR